MKIICFSRIDGELKMVLKGDSCILNNQKPFFIPDWSDDVRMTPCVAVRVSRLGKNIGARFAERYYDAVALALNIHAADYMVKGDWTRAWAFDFSLPIGPWMAVEDNPWQDLVVSIEDAIEMASQTMTIRQGDFLVIDRAVESRQLTNEEVIRVEENGKDLLCCKIK